METQCFRVWWAAVTRGQGLSVLAGLSGSNLWMYRILNVESQFQPFFPAGDGRFFSIERKAHSPCVWKAGESVARQRDTKQLGCLVRCFIEGPGVWELASKVRARRSPFSSGFYIFLQRGLHTEVHIRQYSYINLVDIISKSHKFYTLVYSKL